MILDFWDKIGWLFFPLFLLGLFSWYNIVHLIVFFYRERKSILWRRKKINTFSNQSINTNNISSILDRLVFILQNYLLYGKFIVLAKINNEIGASLNRYETKIKHLMIISKVAPLLGLLGTINGIVKTFTNIEEYGNTNPAFLSDNISHALLTTQIGLTIAIPAFLFYFFFRQKIDTVISFLDKHLE